ncbi:hypothetical protein IC620_13110 [Hazenella sp. IB182357]|uniref:Alpha-D-phosphohexomutase alpha/beta/alpha domain-containing protein n=1 Tax=Polycladospora coralii TaxID=2771432 RepID=A0A926RUQ9_9BACL|nr:hypothetical protein [Polycladospora coralii]MBS7528903.1 hypothetical protein [Polycladospora coralii]
MNKYTIRKIATGFARHLILTEPHVFKKGIVIAYDSRLYSYEFAVETAEVLLYHDIPVYLFSKLTPTPILSFAVRHLQTVGGL